MQPPKLSLNKKQTQNIKQMQRLIMSQEMQQALHFLELPIMELQPLIEKEMEQNPLLESEEEDPLNEHEQDERASFKEEEDLNFNQRDFKIMEELDEEFKNHFNQTGTQEKKQTVEDEKLKNYLESLVLEKKSLFTHVMEQCQEIFENPLHLKIAESLIGNFDDHGFLPLSLQEISILTGHEEKELRFVLEKIKTLDPKGIGASNLQESLLLQLELNKKEKSLAYEILKNYYPDLLKNRLTFIKKTLKISEELLTVAIKEIKKLDLNPALSFSKEPLQYIVPDITIILEEDNSFTIFVNEDPLPPLRLNEKYLKWLNDKTLKPETKEFIEKKIASAKWMIRNLTERNETLVKIAHLLVKKQKSFLLEREGLLIPLTMREIAEELGVNESTVTRAVSNKYMNTPKGILSLRSFFTTGYIGQDGSDVSSEEVKHEILNLIRNEEKRKPLSDASLSKMIEKKGLACARRTVAKYRKELGVKTARERKIFSLKNI